MFAAQRLTEPECEAAVAEAKRRWGHGGSISLADEYLNASYLVGELVGWRFVVRGRGRSWQTAFSDADARSYCVSRRCSDR